MKKLLNPLYITTPEASLTKDGTNIVVSVSGKEVFRIPVQNVQSVITFGYMGVSPGMMKLCADNGVSISFHTPQGKFISRLQGPINGNVLLRTRQYSLLTDHLMASRLASLTVTAKIYNSRVTLRRFVRDYPERQGHAEVIDAANRLGKYYRQTRHTTDDIALLRGIEGESAAVYFKAFRHLILRGEKEFAFNGRNRRPPTDIVNAMLSFGYSLLASDCTAALEGVGLDPAVGYMHTLRPGRPSLALDLMEELRSYIVDRFVLSMINNRQISPSDFHIHTATDDPNPASVMLTEAGRKNFLGAWQTKKRTEIIHPFLNEKVSLGLLPHVQAMLLARYLRGDLDDYPVFLSK
ncbi:MAG: type I-C CRISPR-associated endonuclease Cas1c [Paramuribaculum sp.]|nr:type I-C CRISPR-associated endonuclease Cas1c [Paramuribaculum sp.]